MFIEVRYAVIFGKGDASDWISWDIELTEEEEMAFKNAIENDFPLDEVEELRDVIQRAYDDIELEEIDLAIEQEDEYVMECQGVLEMDAEELNDLVANRDVHALEFFGLTGADDDELEEWDAYELDKLPLIEEFVEDFTPSSPFDTAWTLKVEFLDADEYDIE